MPKNDSQYLAHFTKSRPFFNSDKNDPNSPLLQMDALGRLISILDSKTITASVMPWTNTRAVCFTECPWFSLLQHVNSYSPYGIGFKKKVVYNKGGNPVFYANPDIFFRDGWPEEIKGFFTPFVPRYASKETKKKLGSVRSDKSPKSDAVDYSHEREWRILSDFSFDYGEIAFVVLKRVGDLGSIPEHIRQEIGLDRFIFIEAYTAVEDLWPTHIIGDEQHDS